MKYLKNSKILFLIIFFINLSFFAPIENVYILSKGISVALLSILNLTVPITCALMEIPTGVMGDYLGRKKTLLMSIGCFALNSFILLFANNFISFFVYYLIEGIGWSFFTGNTDSIVVEDAKSKNFDIGTQLAFIYTGFSISPIISGAINSIIVSTEQTSFKMLILLTLLMKSIALILVFFIADIGDNNHEKSKPFAIFMKTFRYIFSSKDNIAIIVYEATGRLQFYIPVLVQALLTNNLFNVKLYGMIYSIVQGINIFVQANANKILTRLGNRKVLFLSPIMLAVGILFLITKNSIFIIIGFAIISIIGPIRNQPLMIIKNNNIDNSIRSTYLSSISCMVLIINVAMLSIIGFIFERNSIIALSTLILFILAGGIFSINKFQKK